MSNSSERPQDESSSVTAETLLRDRQERIARLVVPAFMGRIEKTQWPPGRIDDIRRDVHKFEKPDEIISAISEGMSPWVVPETLNASIEVDLVSSRSVDGNITGMVLARYNEATATLNVVELDPKGEYVRSFVVQDRGDLLQFDSTQYIGSERRSIQFTGKRVATRR